MAKATTAGVDVWLEPDPTRLQPNGTSKLTLKFKNRGWVPLTLAVNPIASRDAAVATAVPIALPVIVRASAKHADNKEIADMAAVAAGRTTVDAAMIVSNALGPLGMCMVEADIKVT